MPPYNASQFGTLLIFKPGLRKEEIEAKLRLIQDLLESKPQVNGFDPAWGYPCWYVP